jgi:hypothetical protein
VAVVVMANLVVALVGLAAISTQRHAEGRSLVGAVTAAEPSATGSLGLGCVTAGLDSVGIGADLLAPGGPTLTPNVSLGAEPCGADGILVPIFTAVANGSDGVTVETPRIGSIQPIEVNVNVTGVVKGRVRGLATV